MDAVPAPDEATRLDAYDHAAVEARWRRIWDERGDYRTALDRPERPFYNLMMFPYPSAEGLHVGHIIPFAGGDIYGRWRRLMGDNVFEPMGFDAFGIHSENYAMKIGEHPAVVMRRAVTNFRENQLKRIGSMFDWSHQVNTAEPDYYRWTQWLFVTLFNAGLIEWREGAVNWCPSCLTVLADEQVEQGRCERCHTVVQTRYLRQWWLKITRYAQELLDALDTLDWSESTKTMQRNWIGRSEGATIRFDLEGCRRSDVTVYTTRPDTLFGATFLVIGADHPELEDFVPPDRIGQVNAWRNKFPPAAAEPDFSIGMELGSYGIHPLTGARMPVWAAPYVLGGYGTGAIMAVPAHDTRDWAFATAHDLPIVEVISGGNVAEAPYAGDGPMVNSGEFDGLPAEEGKRRVVERLAELGRGERSVQFKLRDWLISRQRYWGPPIPIIHCSKDGPVAVPEEDLPVLLPDVEDFRPRGTGMSPLATVEEWVNVACPKCGGPARRETDVSDTFLELVVVLPAVPVDRLRRRRVRQGADRCVAAGRHVHRRQRARGPAPAVLAVRHARAARPRPGARAGAVRTIPRPRHDHHGRRQDVEESRQRPQSRRVHRPLRRGQRAPVHDVPRPVHDRRRLPRQGHRGDAPIPQPRVARDTARHRRGHARRAARAPATPPHQDRR